MKVLFFGTGSFGIPSLERLRSSDLLTGVVSTPDKPGGRKLQTRSSPVKEWALANGLPYWDYPPELKTQPRPDLLVTASFGAILPSGLLTFPRLYALNLHASLLPKYRGASPMQSALLNGDKETGISVIRMIERLDAGDVLLQKKTAVAPDEDVLQLEGRLSALAADALMESIESIEKGNAKFTVQAEAGASYVKKISKNDGRIDWKLPAAALHDRVRAFLRWPGSYFFFGSKRFLILKSEAAPGKASAPPGAVLDAGDAAGLLVAAGGGSALRILTIQLEGKKALPWKEFRKGFSVKAGDLFE